MPDITEAHVRGKRVVVRADFNVSLTNDNTIANDTRIREAIPTIEYLLKKGASVILLSHLGRPKGIQPELSLSCVAKRLEELLKRPVRFATDYLNGIPKGDVVLCENVRFHDGEEENDPRFAKKLAKLGDVFVNDAFGTAHRAHASTVGVAAYLPSYAGLLLSREVRMIRRAAFHPKRPLLVIIGGGKTPEKIRVIEKLLDVADTIYLGGAVANTFFATWGIGVGVSRVDHEMIEMARNVLWKATRVKSRLLLPSDVMVSNGDRTTLPSVLPYNKVPMGLGIYDIGPHAREELGAMIKKAHTIIWNGPMGLYEDHRFAEGTAFTFRSIAQSNAFSIVGGGDTITVIQDESEFAHIGLVSTGGSAMLEFIEKGTLPVIEALKNESILVLVRHGESEWNAKNVWTGLTDIGLTDKGRDEATKAGGALKDLSFDVAFTSPLSRAKETLQIMLRTLQQSLRIIEHAALNERDYGIYTGKNKFEIERELGEAEFKQLRRGWDYPIPEGESLKDVYARVVPYYEKEILPFLKAGKRVLVSAHGNSLRALIKYLDKISDEDISNVELATGEIVLYRIDSSGRVLSHEKRKTWLEI